MRRIGVTSTLRRVINKVFTHFVTGLEQSIKQYFRPAKTNLLLDIVADITRSKSELIAENAFLRQQLIVLQRQTKRPVLMARDRSILVVLASRLCSWREALLFVKPDTLLSWHRQGFRLFWRYKSNSKTRLPRVLEEVIALIHTMVLDNHLWGTKRIRDELTKLAYRLTKRTVAKYIRQVRPTQATRKSSQPWSSFVRNHAKETWACDFLQTYDLWFSIILSSLLLN